jgi:hypothetical protein
MKICPQCRNKYTDETLNFCLQDGAELIGIGSESGSAPTVSLEESETLVAARQPEQITVAAGTSRESDWEESRETKIGGVRAESNDSSKTVRTVFLTALAMVILFGLIGLGALVYFNLSGDGEVADTPGNDVNRTTDETPDNSGIDLNPVNDAGTPETNSSPVATASASPEKTQRPTPAPDTEDPAVIKKEIASKIYAWKSLAESRSLDPYMDMYASSLDYYTKSGASKSFVRRDKQNAFNKFDTIRISIGNLSVTPGSDGRTATAVYDKQWLFAGGGKQNTGKVRSQLKFKKSGDRWLITSERDLKIYYVNK